MIDIKLKWHLLFYRYHMYNARNNFEDGNWNGLDHNLHNATAHSVAYVFLGGDEKKVFNDAELSKFGKK